MVRRLRVFFYWGFGWNFGGEELVFIFVYIEKF